ncbi:hypothetical protein [Ranid herpesvirus 3]|uniref:GIY-YIG domain-containing protein n=1 Tax=Ranid herpesvirus 3 TaxID=1987509 RepID=A0A1X9T5F3_9VIRU|nr:hypothetical protein [Ranid herpesvirus 3]ARR28930.1 hypothetical protein [Ranid herpesvirus 3]
MASPLRRSKRTMNPENLYKGYMAGTIKANDRRLISGLDLHSVTEAWTQVRQISSLLLSACRLSDLRIQLTKHYDAFTTEVANAAALWKITKGSCEMTGVAKSLKTFRTLIYDVPAQSSESVKAGVILKLALLLESNEINACDLNDVSITKLKFERGKYDRVTWGIVNDTLARVALLTPASIKKINDKKGSCGLGTLLIHPLSPPSSDLTDAFSELSIDQLGSYPCGESACEACRVMSPCFKIKSHSNGKIIKLKQRITCGDRNVIYVCACAACGMQYVGKTTQTARRRIGQHIRNLKRKHNGGIPKHMNETHDAMQPILFTLVQSSDNPDELNSLEAKWIDLMGTMRPKGMNMLCASQS